MWKYRWAPSLGRLDGTAEQMWGIEAYDPKLHQENPVVFFGCYGLPDFMALRGHKGRKAILWAGTDILHFQNGYWLDDKGSIRVSPRPFAQWIRENCESWVENKTEYDALNKFGIEAKVCPSFLGDINDYPLSFKASEKVRLYSSVSGDNFEQYGWNRIEEIAPKYPDYEFHLYGNKKEWKSKHPNVIVHGRLTREDFNEQAKGMTGGLRPLLFDGFSEILGKSLLWGQWPVAMMEYPHILKLDEMDKLRDKKEPNLAGREFYLKTFNNYPWNLKNT